MSKTPRTTPDRAARRRLLGEESGRISIRAILALAVVVGGVYAGMKFLPVRASAYEFNDAVRDEVVFAGARRSKDDNIKRTLINRAHALRLPINSGDIRITRAGNKYITIDVSYAVPIELVGGYTFTWKFSPHHEGPLIF